jgi:hypothetical protein
MSIHLQSFHPILLHLSVDLVHQSSDGYANCGFDTRWLVLQQGACQPALVLPEVAISLSVEDTMTCFLNGTEVLPHTRASATGYLHART